MKKAVLTLMAVLIAVSASACSLVDSINTDIKDSEETVSETVSVDRRDYDIVLVTDSGGVESEENRNIWKSIIAYGDSNCKTYKYYSSDESGDSESAVAEAVSHNAEIIVFPDSGYKDTVLNVQSEYPGVNFLILDTQPDSRFNDNVHCINFREEQAGYLAGYFAVMDGYKTLGFLGDGESDGNTRYIYGMIRGADNAAQEQRIHDIKVKYAYTKDDESAAKSASQQMYDSGIEVIFACSENIVNGVDLAAKESGKKLICGEKIYSGFGEEALAFIEFDHSKAVSYSVSTYFDSELDWLRANEEKDISLGIDSGCIGISTDEGFWNFENFGCGVYEKFCERFIGGEIEISDNIDDVPTVSASSYEEFEIKGGNSDGSSDK